MYALHQVHCLQKCFENNNIPYDRFFEIFDCEFPVTEKSIRNNNQGKFVYSGKLANMKNCELYVIAATTKDKKYEEL